MKLLRRNCSEFTYRPYLGESDLDTDGYHTGEFTQTYGDPVTYRGNLSVPNGYAMQTVFGLDIRYTHVLLMDEPEAEIDEYGLVEWKGGQYEVRAVRPSLNVLAVALRKLTANHAERDDS